MLFVRAATMLDSAAMDYESSSFTGSELASGVFNIVLSHERGKEQEREKMLTTVTGYTSNQLKRVIHFLNPYRVSPDSILNILDREMVQNLRQAYAPTNEHFRIEEDQTPSCLDEEHYRELVETRVGNPGYCS
jgi:Cyclin, C-terminal domain